MKFTLVIPCYNEEKSLPALIARCKELLTKTSDLEIILVDNGSQDNSKAIFKELNAEMGRCRSVEVVKNQGYGFGILSGLRAAKGDVLGWTHADLQTDPFDFLQAVAIFEANPQKPLFVKGRRYGRPFMDVFFTIGMTFFELILLRRWLWDINAQPTVFTRAFFESWDTPPSDFSLDLYAYFLAKKQGLSVKRYPVLFAKRLHGVSHWNVNWSAKWKFIKRTIEFSLTLKERAIK